METRPKYLLAALTLAYAAACASSPDDDTGVSDSSVMPGPTSMGGGTADGGGTVVTPGGGTSDAGATPGGGSTDAGSGGSAAGSSDAGAGGAAGGSDAGGRAGGAAADCTGDVPAMNDDLITNFEDGTVGVNAVTGRGGGFYIFNDKMNDKVAQTFEVKAKADRCSDGSSQYAFCTKGGGFTIWGAGFGTDLGITDTATMKKTTVDLSAYTGISFWIVRNTGMAATAKLIVADKNTAEEGGNCTNMAGALDKDKCDPYSANVPISAKWTKQTVKFASLKQGAWGKPSPTFAKEAVYGIQFQFAQMIDFDVCFDQLVLLR